jgi:glyoxylase-like metal-dependent hydrolase (beta-lactamase superfamily II)
VSRKLGIVAAVSIALIGLIAIGLYNRIVSFETERVTDSVHVIFGLGGNTAVLETEDGVVVVDTMSFPLQGRRIREQAERLGGGPTQAIVNTHYHTDHTHGNPAWAAGTRIVSTESTRAYLDHFDRGFWQGGAAESAPSETFEDAHEMRIGGKTIRSYHMGRGHTGGDLVVLFVEDRVLHAGDLFFHRIYPDIDLEAGGSVREWGATLERVLALDFDTVIPGHGAVTDRAGLREFQRFIAELAEVAGDAVAAGKTLKETLESTNLKNDAEFEEMSIPLLFKFDRDFVVQRAWEEAAGIVKPVDLEDQKSM